VECLRRIRILLSEVDSSDRVKYCKPDYDIAVKALRKQKHVWTNGLFKEVIAITVQYFNANHFQKLPLSCFIEVIGYIPVEELSPLFLVNEEWREVCSCSEMWSTFYRQKFLLNNPGRLPSMGENMKLAFQKRLADPQIGDKVEVAWRGKFRLETTEVYHGLAWWVAEIVEKQPEQGRYKIRYPGWDSRWDEWVPRNRLRWKVATNTLVSIQPGDVVELWCCGANVPGAWLECKVKKIRNAKYNLGRITASGNVSVGRERIRLVRRPAEEAEVEAVSPPSPTRGLFGGIRRSVSQRFQDLLGGGGGGGGDGEGEDADPRASCAIS
jgi:hypothetical protein